MPIIPSAEPRLQTPTPRAVPPPEDPFAHVVKIADHIGNVYDDTEATRIAGEASANLDGVVKIANEKYGDPDEFAVRAAQDAQDVYNKALGAARNSRQRDKVEAKLADNYNKARNGIAFDALKKKHDAISGNWELEKYNATTEFPDLNDAGKETKIKEIASRARDLAKAGVLKHKDAELDIAKFQHDAWRQDASIFASKFPIEFQDAVDQGRYQGKLTGEDIRLASEIAERKINANEAHDARFMKKVAKDAEQSFYEQAKAKTLNETDLLNAQRLYGWSKEKVDAIMRVQLGVKESSPYADQLIAQAARLDDPINPTTQMVAAAQTRLDKLVDTNKISRDSVEYNRVTRELRIVGQMASRSSSPENQEKSRAKTYMRDLLRSKAPDMDTEARNQLLGTYFTDINTMQGTQGLDALKQKFAKELDSLGKQVTPSKDAADRLKGLAR
jgi:hypothetical protein